MISRRAFGYGLGAAALAGGARADARKDVVLPFKFTAGSIWAPVLVDGKGPFRFLIDTGQGFFNISRETAKALSLPRFDPSVDGVTPHGAFDLDVFVARRVQLDSAMVVERVDMIARDYGFHEVYQGFIPFFATQPSSFDFENNRMTIHGAGFSPPAGAGRVPLIRPPEGSMGMGPRIEAELDGMPLKLTVSTGSPLGLSLHPAAVRRLKLWDRYLRALKNTVVSKEDGEHEIRTVRAERLRFAGFDVLGPVVRLDNPKVDPEAKGFRSDGTIGLDLLWRFHFGFDPKRREAWFAPHTELEDPFAYDRSGVEVREEGERIVVDRLLPGGPAEKAGLRLGDVLAWPNQAAAIQADYRMRGEPGSVVTLPVERDGKAMSIAVTLEELI